MDLLIDVILRAGRSAVELSFFILLPVMIVMVSLMRLLEARGVLDWVVARITPALRPLGLTGLGGFAALQINFVSFAAPVATLAMMDQRGASSPPTTDQASSGPNCRPMAAIGIDTLAWAIASTIARVAARWRLEAPRWSIIARVATGAAKLTKLICRAAKPPRPVRPSGRRAGVRRATTQSSTPRASSRRISEIITIITGSRMKNESSTAERPARRMTSIRRSMGMEGGEDERRIIMARRPAHKPR